MYIVVFVLLLLNVISNRMWYKNHSLYALSGRVRWIFSHSLIVLQLYFYLVLFCANFHLTFVIFNTVVMPVCVFFLNKFYPGLPRAT